MLAAIDSGLVAFPSAKKGVPYYRLHSVAAKAITRKKFIFVSREIAGSAVGGSGDVVVAGLWQKGAPIFCVCPCVDLGRFHTTRGGWPYPGRPMFTTSVVENAGVSVRVRPCARSSRKQPWTSVLQTDMAAH